MALLLPKEPQWSTADCKKI